MLSGLRLSREFRCRRSEFRRSPFVNRHTAYEGRVRHYTRFRQDGYMGELCEVRERPAKGAGSDRRCSASARVRCDRASARTWAVFEPDSSVANHTRPVPTASTSSSCVTPRPRSAGVRSCVLSVRVPPRRTAEGPRIDDDAVRHGGAWLHGSLKGDVGAARARCKVM